MNGKRVFYFSFHKQIVHRGLTTNYATILAILHSVGCDKCIGKRLGRLGDTTEKRHAITQLLAISLGNIEWSGRKLHLT